MEAKELRIGNYFIYNADGCFPNNPEWESNTITVVRQIKEGGVGITHLKNMENGGVTIGGLGLIKPIPLTEEWMHRLEGSEYSTIYLYKGGDRWFVSIKSSATDCDYYNPGKEIKYVHEWQNAYKFWEDEELTIKK